MNNFENEYRQAMDNIHASDELRQKICNLKPARRAVTPFKATLATVAAAVMITVVALDYDFTPNTDGVITETAVSTQMPKSEIVAPKKDSEDVPPVIKKEEEKKSSASVEQRPVTAPIQPTEAVVTTDEVQEAEPVAYEEQAPSVARFGGGSTEIAVEAWDTEKYFEYIGSNPIEKISTVIPVTYVGGDKIEVEVNAAGEVVYDTAVLPYAGDNGEAIDVTVSKQPIFDSSKDNTIESVDAGYEGYAVSNDAYYHVMTEGVTEEVAEDIIESL